MNAEQRVRVRLLNDTLRQHHRGGRIMLGAGVVAMGPAGVQAALNAVDGSASRVKLFRSTLAKLEGRDALK